jgi:hypothetical protein
MQDIESYIYLASAILCLLLLALSITAFRKSHKGRLIYIMAAFAVFSVYLFWEFLESAQVHFGAFSNYFLSSLVLAVLVLFFLGLSKSK